MTRKIEMIQKKIRRPITPAKARKTSPMPISGLRESESRESAMGPTLT
jgi:hypothetical protein